MEEEHVPVDANNVKYLCTDAPLMGLKREGGGSGYISLSLNDGSINLNDGGGKNEYAYFPLNHSSFSLTKFCL